MLLASVVNYIAVVLTVGRVFGSVEPHHFVKGCVGGGVDFVPVLGLQIVVDEAEDGAAEWLDAPVVLEELSAIRHPVEDASVFDCRISRNNAALFASSGEAEDIVAADILLNEDVVVR